MLEDGCEYVGARILYKVSTDHDGVREVYHAVRLNSAGEERMIVLVVYNLEAQPYASMKTARKKFPDFITEVNFYRETVDSCYSCIPRYEIAGITRHGSRRLAWMQLVHAGITTLAEIIKRRGALPPGNAIGVAKGIAAILSEIKLYTKGGGHYNIGPDTIRVRGEGLYFDSHVLAGFWNIGPAHKGDFKIEQSPLNRLFQAPEAAKGFVNFKSDIYSLGMVLLTMLMGFPSEKELAAVLTDLDEGVTPEVEMLSPEQFRTLMMKRAETRLSASLRLVMGKAVEPKPEARFASPEKFLTYFMKTCVTKAVLKPTWKTPAEADNEGSYVVFELHDDCGGEKTADTLSFESLKPTATKETQQIKNSAAQSLRKKESLDDVAGMEELKSIFRRDFIRILQNPKVAEAYGIRPSNCTLLYGPQGCGKTFIAKKAAIESGLNYRIVNPSELGSIYIHGSQEKIAKMFEDAERVGPTILIFDEFDALVPKRDSEYNEKQAGEVNEMLTQLNNCSRRGIYVIATTNRPTLLDPAIMRKGRVDRTIYVALPDFEARKELFRMELAKRPVTPDVDCDALARATDNYTCSDITYIVDETARICFEETLNKKLDSPLPLSMEHLMATTQATQPSVNEGQRREFAELRTQLEGKESGLRKKVGFLS